MGWIVLFQATLGQKPELVTSTSRCGQKKIPEELFCSSCNNCGSLKSSPQIPFLGCTWTHDCLVGCVDCVHSMNEDWAWLTERLGMESQSGWLQGMELQCQHWSDTKCTHGWLNAILQVWLVHFIHLGAEAAYWQSPRVASCYEIQEMPHLAQSNARDPVKSAAIPALAD